MHGLNMAAKPPVGLPSLPVSAFGRCGSLLRNAFPATPLKPAPRNGLSLAHSDCPFPGHLCKVSAPGLLLQRHGRFRQARSITNSAPRCPFPGGGELHCPRSVACLGRPPSKIPRDFAPLWDFLPSGSSLGLVRLRKAYLEKRPVSFAPRQRKGFTLPRSRITVPDPFRPRGSLFREPLGTNSIMLPFPASVK
jgi:hypothetical protein